MEPTNRINNEEVELDFLNLEAQTGVRPESQAESFFRERVVNAAKAKEQKAKRVFSRTDDVQNAGTKLIKAFSKHGITAIPFCIHQGKEQSFAVQGSNFKWNVIPINTYKEIMSMPSTEWKSLAKLQQSAIQHNGVFVAVPLKDTAVDRIFKELDGMTKTVGGAFLALLSAPFLVLTPIIPTDYKDPVLLVRFSGFNEGNLFLEIGRWD
jgi:hypothetical protein